MLSYLPLCHVAERIFSGWFGAGAGVCVHFAESIETVATNLHEVQPTILFGVPRIWEKIAAGVQIRVASADPVKRADRRLLAASSGLDRRRTRGQRRTSYRWLQGWSTQSAGCSATAR